MNCEQARAVLENLTLPLLRESRYAALHTHLGRCESCGELWERWLLDEEKMALLSIAEKAPKKLLEEVMSRLEADSLKEGIAAVDDLYLEASSKGLRCLTLLDRRQDDPDGLNAHSPSTQDDLLKEARQQLAQYFRGERAIFRLPIDLSGATPFEREVLEAATGIPYGEVKSYKWIAEKIGRPNAFRAVGGALHNNPVPILIPCHRVVKSAGGLGGYAFGEDWKNRLLSLERETSPYAGCSSTRILCYRGCPYGPRVLEGNRVHFADYDEGLESGYRPCKVCRPVRAGMELF